MIIFKNLWNYKTKINKTEVLIGFVVFNIETRFAQSSLKFLHPSPPRVCARAQFKLLELNYQTDQHCIVNGTNDRQKPSPPPLPSIRIRGQENSTRARNQSQHDFLQAQFNDRKHFSLVFLNLIETICRKMFRNLHFVSNAGLRTWCPLITTFLACQFI